MSAETTGLLFPVCDGPLGDGKHFPRFRRELTRLGLPFAVYFDHVSRPTYDLFKSHPLFLGSYDDEDPGSHFTEASRQHALDILVRAGFDRSLQMDVDETLERDAPRRLREEVPAVDADVIVFPCWDLWGSHRTMRVDGPQSHGSREKVHRLRGNHLKYPSATSHAPNVTPHGKTCRDARVFRMDLKILHWGIMDLADAQFHRERWDRVYTRAVGRNPYGSYEYYFDPATEVRLADVPEDLVPEHCLPGAGA